MSGFSILQKTRRRNPLLPSKGFPIATIHCERSSIDEAVSVGPTDLVSSLIFGLRDKALRAIRVPLLTGEASLPGASYRTPVR